ncbi:alcohol dehydrogenase-like 6 [Pyrus ussuriensis x Pyrus communis]|uniref:alcohol dehydrogenase n=1 Tax=Pyrus ussuriensis x Pyrus communis TaxID=2448454 RepID=A0A5N5I3V3_9ROSA|nr:alcohol dehydrogenase-like 6 [Pyrus ussuriensis x Pyrus communis]
MFCENPNPNPNPNENVKAAAVAWGAGQPLVIEQVNVSPPQPMEIRIKVVCTSLCRSDLSAWESQTIFPRIFGHEATGIVESVGEGVTEFTQGDHVLTVFIGECGKCRQCESGKTNICQLLGLERRGLMHCDQRTRFSINATGEPVYHYCAVSSFSEYTVVHSGCAVKISSLVPLEKVCLLSCGVAAGLGAAWNVADISDGSSVVIFGLGTVGLSVAQGANLRGASQIIGVDTNPEKGENAKAFGITEFINPNDSKEPIQQVILTKPYGPDGSPSLNLNLLSKTLKGSLFGGWKPKSDLPSLVEMYTKKEIQVDEYISHNLPFEDVNKAFNLMLEGKCLRCVIHMEN